jgi:hypothetical protein
MTVRTGPFLSPFQGLRRPVILCPQGVALGLSYAGPSGLVAALDILTRRNTF